MTQYRNMMNKMSVNIFICQVNFLGSSSKETNVFK